MEVGPAQYLLLVLLSLPLSLSLSHLPGLSFSIGLSQAICRRQEIFILLSSHPPKKQSVGSLPRSFLIPPRSSAEPCSIMQDPLSLHFNLPHHFPFPLHDLPPPSLHPPRTLRLPAAAVSSKSSSSSSSAAAATISLPPKPPKTTVVPSPPPPPPLTPPLPSHAEFEEKMLFLDSFGIDFFSLIGRHPAVAAAPLPDLKSTVHFLSSMDFTAVDLRRIVGMCPEVLTSRVADVLPVFAFLLREARVNGSDLRRVINRRPRLLACSVKHRLRPTLYFLQSIGIAEVNKYTSLLSCSVEDKFVPRIEYFKNVGFSHRDAIVMFRRFPQLFCYSIKENLEPKFNYFVVEMGRDLKELKEFPHYFSFSLENRIKPRHQCCVEKGVCFPLPVMLKTSEEQFQKRLDICCNSSMPLSSSPLWCTNCED
ncbi:hypothetical protein BT93_K1057 [Corymbia citriodora subsp. variegata]|nr:hypothetical protein BT93_K1057 [Corymbia citriodora subsp. variegata]